MSTNIPIIINWNDFNLKKNQISLTKFVENNSDKIRELYIDAIDFLGKKKINQLSFIELLKLNNDFSIWWMSLIYEKNFYKSPQVINCLKLIALEYLIIDKKFLKVKIINLPNICNNSIYILQKKLKVDIDWKINNEKQGNIFYYKINSLIPNFFRSVFTLIKYSYFARKVKNSNSNEAFNNQNVITLVTYFLNFDESKICKNFFHSDYWGSLNIIIKKMGYKIRWLHLISDNNFSYKKFKNNFRSINLSNKNEQHHFLEGNITNKIILKTFFLYLKIFLKVFFIKKQQFFLKNENDMEYLWDILKHDLLNSLSGPNLIRNILIYNLLNSFFEKKLNHSKLFYLHEGQGWEKSLIYLFKKNNINRKIFGVIQSPVRFWDLKLFDKPNLNSINKLSLPFPHKLAINTYDGIKMLTEYGVDRSKLIEVEPLRYKKLEIKKENENLSRKFKILILGSFVQSITTELINSIDTNHNYNEVSYRFRSHPGNKIGNLKQPIYNDENYSIEVSISKSDLLIIAGDSSVAVESYLAQKNIIIFLGCGNLNYSPLRGNYGVKFAADKSELNKYIKTYLENRSEFKSSSLKKIYVDSYGNEKWEKLFNRIN